MTQYKSIFHNKGIRPCYGVAFFYLGDTSLYAIVKSEDAVLLNNEKAIAGEPIRCGTCGRFVNIGDLEVYREDESAVERN